MTRYVHKLTPGRIIALTKPGRVADGQGLYYVIAHGGAKSWLLRYTIPGQKETWMTLGKVDIGNLTKSLADARAKAQEARDYIAGGGDPQAQRKAALAEVRAVNAVTFQECAMQYMAAHSADWRSKAHREQWRTSLAQYAYPELGKLAVDAINVDHVQPVLGNIWRDKPETARRLRSRIERVLDFASLRKWRNTENAFRMNIVRELLGRGRPKPKHHASIPYRDVPEFMAKLGKRKDTPSLAVQWLILTAVRSKEGRLARWPEIDRRKGAWTVPAVRMKGAVEHTVPLSAGALAVLDAVPRYDGIDFIFAGQGGGDGVSATACRNVLRDLGVKKGDGTPHGFRASFRTWCAENSVADDVAEACLAHTIPDRVERAYKRAEFKTERKKVMDAWSLHVLDGLPG